MRKQNNLLDSFLPKHEKEWESRLFIDEAIKNSVEFHLETIARALCGKYEIKLKKAHERPFERTEHIEGDCKSWIRKTERFEWEASFDCWVIYGKNKTQMWLNIIDFWAGKQTVFPSGATGYRNEASEENKAKAETNQIETD
jgi:hypothetical protein